MTLGFIKNILYNWNGLNISLFTFLNQKLNIGHCPFVLMYISTLFNIACFPIYYCILIYYFRHIAHRNDVFEQPNNLLVQLGSTYGFLVAIYIVFKFTLNLPRPYCSLQHYQSLEDFTNARCLSSFPSAHTAMAVMYSYILLRRHKIFCFFMVGLVAASRISLAMHYPADIAYSIIISLLVCVSVNHAMQKVKPYQN